MPNENLFEQAKERAQQLISDRQTTIQMFDRMEDIFNLEPGDLPDHDWIRQTVSPDARNKLQGAVRLLTATDPVWSISYDRNDYALKDRFSPLEKFAARAFSASGRITKKPVHFDAVLSALLYGEVHISVASTKSIEKLTGSARAQDATRFTPAIWSILPPRCGYPEFDVLGLCTYLYRQEITIGKLLGMFGDKVKNYVGDRSRFDKVYINDFYDDVNRVSWTDDGDGAIMAEPHGYPCIPIATGIVEGSNLFIRSGQDQVQPFLYTLDKSQVHNRQSELMTVIFSLLYSMGVSPNFVFEALNAERQLPPIDMRHPFNVIPIIKGESFTSLQSQLFKPEMSNALTLLDQKVTESTIYNQTLGQPISGQAAYSTTALLNQSGRVALIPAQKITSWVLGDAQQIMFKMLKQDGGTSKIGGDNSSIELKAADIPDVFEIECQLEIDMPTDDRQNAQIAAQLTGGDNPLTSVRWAREKILKIGQSDDMEKEIFDEKMTLAKFQMELAKQQQQLQMQLQQQAMPQQPQGVQPQQPLPGQPQQGASQQMPPEIADMQGLGEQMPGQELQPPIQPYPTGGANA